MSSQEIMTCSACCSDVRLQLTEPEAAQLTDAGTQLTTVLPIMYLAVTTEPEPGEESAESFSWSDRSCMLAIGVKIREATDPEKKEAWLQIARFAMQMRSGEGLYDMIGKCGNLQFDGSCADYANRPRICREFEVDGTACQALKREATESVPVVLGRKPVN